MMEPTLCPTANVPTDMDSFPAPKEDSSPGTKNPWFRQEVFLLLWRVFNKETLSAIVAALSCD